MSKLPEGFPSSSHEQQLGLDKSDIELIRQGIGSVFDVEGNTTVFSEEAIEAVKKAEADFYAAQERLLTLQEQEKKELYEMAVRVEEIFKELLVASKENDRKKMYERLTTLTPLLFGKDKYEFWPDTRERDHKRYLESLEISLYAVIREWASGESLVKDESGELLTIEKVMEDEKNAAAEVIYRTLHGWPRALQGRECFSSVYSKDGKYKGCMDPSC